MCEELGEVIKTISGCCFYQSGEQRGVSVPPGPGPCARPVRGGQ